MSMYTLSRLGLALLVVASFVMLLRTKHESHPRAFSPRELTEQERREDRFWGLIVAGIGLFGVACLVWGMWASSGATAGS